MQRDLENLTSPVLRYGLRLRQRLELGDPCDLATEQAALKGLLRSPLEAQPSPTPQGDGDRFLGSRYALVCWLDELFISDSPWSGKWAERKLEEALYGTNDRAWKFWAQARLAQGGAEGDALETFFLCVKFGFRGELRGQPDRLAEWCDSTEAILSRRRAASWPAPPELPPEINVAPLRGRERLRSALLLLGVVVCVLFFVLSFSVVYLLRTS
jgi:type VI protein secretion system component VasF